MLDETKADAQLERLMELAEEEYTSAESSEDKKAAMDKIKSLQGIANDRIKIQNERLNAESRIELECEKLDHDIKYQAEKDRIDQERANQDKKYQAEKDEKDRKQSRREFWINIGLNACKVALVGAGIAIQVIMIHHNDMIETNNISKGITRSIFGRLGDYLKG